MINKTIFFGVLLAISTNLYADSVNIQRPVPFKASQSEAEAGTDNSKMMTPLRTQQAVTTLGVTGQASSIDDEITLFSGTTGKIIKRATTTGIVKSTSGVISSVTTSAGLAGEISDETGSGALVFGTSPTFTGTVTIPTPFTLGAVSVVATGTELNYTDGVTSAIQTQLDGKAPTASPTFTGNVTMPSTGIWNSSGNVGIGIASPASRLTILENAAEGAGTSAMGIGFQYDSTFTRAGIYADGITGWLSALHFATNPGANSHTITPRMTIRDDKVGIGEVLPGSKLSVSGGGSFGAGYDTTAAPTNGLIVEGNVGIGTTTPGSNSKLDVQGYITVLQNSGGYVFNNNLLLGMRYDSNSLRVSAYDHIDFYTYSNASYNEKVRITSAGSVGIGMTNPLEKFHIQNGGTPVIDTGESALDVLIEGATNTFSAHTPNLAIVSNTAQAANNGGTIGFGAKYSGNAWANFAMIRGADNDGSGLPAGYLAFATRTGGGSMTERMRIDPSGSVGIGTSTPSAQLHTTSTVRFQNFGAGTATFDANGNISSVSDERFKTIKGGFTVGLNQILGIKPIMYSWNELSGLDKDNTYTGFSAQNVRKYIPEAISIDAKGYYNMQDKTLIAALVNSVKQLTKEVDELRVALNLVKIDRTSIDRLGDSTAVIKSKIAYLEKECEITEIVKEPKTVVENIDGSEVTKTVEVLKEGITEKAGKYYRLETYEEAALRYSATSQN